MSVEEVLTFNLPGGAHSSCDRIPPRAKTRQQRLCSVLSFPAVPLLVLFGVVSAEFYLRSVAIPVPSVF